MTKKAGRKVIDKYSFCLNSRYYETILNGVNAKKNDAKYAEICNSTLTRMIFSENQNATEICKEFIILYDSLNTYGKEKNHEDETFSCYDCDFLNYWLNNKIKENINNGLNNVKEFYEEIKSKNKKFFCEHEELGKHMNVIDPEILKNMKLLYELYDNAVKIINIMEEPNYKYEEDKSCNDYIEKCDENYRKAMDRCINNNVDYYNALKFFKGSYENLKEPNFDGSNTCNSSKFLFFPKYDPVLEANQRRIMTFKIMSAPLMLPFVIPLLYK
ncbi:PIR Superfamily Protein, partial [Plasmodium ovale curtisi]